MSDGRNVIYLYDGSFEGVLTCVFECYKERNIPAAIKSTENGQLTFESEYRHIETDEEKAKRVAVKIIKCAGYEAYKHIYYTFLSEESEREINIFGYVRMCLKYGKQADKHLTVPCVDFVLDASRRTGHEAHKYTGFVRFSELEGEVYYGEIEPVHNILPIIAHHFEERYKSMPFIINDKKRGMCLVYNGHECIIYPTDTAPKINLSENEKEYRRLWKQFYDTVEIKERHNERCRMTLMPKRYWKYLTEFQETT